MRDKIIEAGQKLKTIILDYTEKNGSNEGFREVELYSFTNKNGIDYFYVFDINKKGIRGFIIDSINYIEIIDNTYDPKWLVKF